MARLLTRHWWALALRGVIAVVFGLLAIVFPPVTFEFLAVFIAAYLAIDGVIAVMAGIRAAETHRPWWPFAIEGLTDLVAGAIIYFQPAVLVVLVAIWAILSGLALLLPAFALPGGGGKYLLILNGAISIILGVAILAQPIAGVVFIVWSIAIYALLFGFGLIALGFRVRALGGSP